MKRLSPTLGVVLAAVLGTAGVLKLSDPFTFSREIEHYQLLVSPWTAVLAVYLPWLELFTAVALLFPRWRLGAALVSAGLSVGYAVALTSAVVRGLDVRCGCFGSADSTTAVAALGRAVGVMLLAAAVIWFERRADRDGDQPETPASAGHADSNK